MDKDKNRTRPIKSSGRKVVKKDYNWEEFDRRKGDKPIRKTPQKQPQIRLLSDEEIKNKYRRQQREKEIKAMRIRALLVLLSCAMLVIILALMTPIFNIRSISVAGNDIITIEEIDAQIGDLKGENLFRTGEGLIKKRLKNIAYVDEVSVSKRILPPSVRVTIIECEPAGFIVVNGVELIINSELKILDDSNRLPTGGIPEIEGMSVSEYNVGKTLVSNDAQKDEAIGMCLSQMEQTGILASVNSIDIENITGIEFMYQNRINVLCGTPLDLNRKLNMFRETILSNNISENAKGTIDLTVTGKAVYTP